MDFADDDDGDGDDADIFPDVAREVGAVTEKW